MSENRLAGVERDVQPGDAGVRRGEMGVVGRSDRYRWHRLEAVFGGGQGRRSGPEVDQVLPLQVAHLFHDAPEPPFELQQLVTAFVRFVVERSV